jgi:polysaccharide export outer membrane protein
MNLDLHAVPVARRFACALLATLLAGCSAYAPISGEDQNARAFSVDAKSKQAELPDRETLAAFEAAGAEPLYRVGEGDKINVTVSGRPEISGKHVVGPDGRIAIPIAGDVKVALATRDEAAHSIRTALQPYYKHPQVTVGVDEYVSNRIILLGRVDRPGEVRFDRPPTLLEALARGGSLPVLDKKATLTRCAIYRGRDQVIWVDLRRLLNEADPTYNIRLKANDLIYIPDSDDSLISVMGDVEKPGAYRLTPDMRLLDALAQAGGPSEKSAPEEIAVYRPSQKAVIHAPLKSLLTGDRAVNVKLEEGDIVYVPRSKIADVGFVLNQLAPGIGFFAVKNLLGL